MFLRLQSQNIFWNSRKRIFLFPLWCCFCCIEFFSFAFWHFFFYFFFSTCSYCRAHTYTKKAAKVTFIILKQSSATGIFAQTVNCHFFQEWKFLWHNRIRAKFAIFCYSEESKSYQKLLNLVAMKSIYCTYSVPILKSPFFVTNDLKSSH